jgi:hypothetical protein
MCFTLTLSQRLLFNIHPETSLHFVRMYDNIYILDEVTLADIGQFKAMYHYDQLPQRSGTWWNQLYHTLEVLRAKRYQGLNTATRLVPDRGALQ